jgi:hypothetical protein
MILVEPGALLTEASRMPGLDGQKMSKSYGNTIFLREEAESLTKKIRTMQTDPARVRRTDPGDPEKCPVWQFHVIYPTTTRNWVTRAARAPASAASSASSRSSTRCSRSRTPCASAPSPISTTEPGAQHRGRRLRQGPQAGPGNHARSPRRDGLSYS